MREHPEGTYDKETVQPRIQVGLQELGGRQMLRQAVHLEEGSSLRVPPGTEADIHEGQCICAGRAGGVSTQGRRMVLVLSVLRVTPCRFQVFRWYNQHRVILRLSMTPEF
jgi:hypothetical protein